MSDLVVPPTEPTEISLKRLALIGIVVWTLDLPAVLSGTLMDLPTRWSAYLLPVATAFFMHSLPSARFTSRRRMRWVLLLLIGAAMMILVGHAVKLNASFG